MTRADIQGIGRGRSETSQGSQLHGPKHYNLGYGWGKVEAFVHQDHISIFCSDRSKPGRLYELNISIPEGMIRERSFIPPNPGEQFYGFGYAPDCKNPRELRPPNLDSMLGELPTHIAGLIKSALQYLS